MIASWNTKYKNSAVKGLVGIAGIYDLPNLAATYPTYKAWFIQSAFGPEKNWPAASPQRAASKTKLPWLLIHSTEDELVSAKQSLDFRDHLKKEKADVEVLLLKDQKHFTAVEELGGASEATKALTRFISRLSK